MKKILFVISPKDFRDIELLEPKRILEAAGISTEIASKSVGEIVGADGARVEATRLAIEANPNDYLAVVFIGGPGMTEYVADEDFIKVAKDFFAAGKLTTAICVAPAILANAEILTNKRATAWPGAKQILVNHKAIWQDQPVVVENQIITASGPMAATEFSERILDLVK